MQAIILKKNIFSEGNEIITLFTRELGKVRAVAKSVKSSKSNLAFGLQSLFYTDVDILLSRRLSTIKGVKALDTFKNIYGDPQRTMVALYATEIILKSTADEQPNPELFELFLNFLKHLDLSESSTHSCVDLFAMEALALNGYAITTERCVICRKTLSDTAQIFFTSQKGGFLCTECSLRIPDARTVSPVVYQTINQNRQSDFDKIDQITEGQHELHKLSESFITYILERNLNTSGLFGKL
jgi:DNA repair protein RecO (recombination protein O)